MLGAHTINSISTIIIISCIHLTITLICLFQNCLIKDITFIASTALNGTVMFATQMYIIINDLLCIIIYIYTPWIHVL